MWEFDCSVMDTVMPVDKARVLVKDINTALWTYFNSTA